MNPNDIALEAIKAITGRENPLENLPDDAIEIALDAGGSLFPAVMQGDERTFVYALMTLTYVGAGFRGKKKWEETLISAKAQYRAAREAIKDECRQAVDDLIASIQQ